jgi:hypothetical protein
MWVRTSLQLDQNRRAQHAGFAERREVAREVGARAAEISRMASASEHTELQQALAL